MKRKFETPQKTQKRKRRKKAQPTPEQIIKCLRAIRIPKGSPGYISKVKLKLMSKAICSLPMAIGKNRICRNFINVNDMKMIQSALES